MALSLDVVSESILGSREHVSPRFKSDGRFNTSWWSSGGAEGSVFCRFLDGDEEVARAKIRPGGGEYRRYTSWVCPGGGATEIDLLEVRVDLRGSGRRYGRQAVTEIANHYGLPVVAM